MIPPGLALYGVNEPASPGPLPWYTFRFVFDDADGHVRVAFELRERRGGLLAEEVVEPVALAGPFKVPFTRELLTSEWGSGHVWFFDIAPGLQLPIDEHRVRQGR